MPYAAHVHPQDSTTGRVGEILHGLVRAASAAGPYAAVDAAVAYASNAGVGLIEHGLGQHPSWAGASKRFLVSIDFGITDPRALSRLSRIASADVRIPNGQAVLASSSLRPPSTFHPKAYLFRGPSWASPSALIVGSANMTVSALATGSEVATSQVWSGSLSSSNRALLQHARTFSDWFEDAWLSSDPLSQILAAYRTRYKQMPTPRGPLEERSKAVKVFTAPAASNVATGTYAVQLMAAQAYWIKTDALYKNLGYAGSQLDMPRGTRVFFGFPAAVGATSGILGRVALRVPGFNEVERSVKSAGNQMDKVNLPIPGRHGPSSYDNSVLIFDRDGTAASGLPRFKLTVTDATGLAHRKAAAANCVNMHMQGGREFGLLF